ncbi:MAG TPA: RNA degradosome polyphosphate kinase [Acidimicrobiales bacterium]|nr:RNA degradosome polyphosphate kinase [Acidimicrobiales bacterium]
MAPAESPVVESTGRTVDISEDPARFSNRELSWLDFNERVLANATFDDVPVLEKAKFCAIFSDNLDEFFQVRVAGLKDQVAAGFGQLSPDGLTPAQQLSAIAGRVRELVQRSEKIFLAQVVPELADAGIVLSDWDSLDDADRRFLVTEFEDRIFPVLTPLSVDPGHPFPYISSLSLNLAVLVRDPYTGERRFARVKVPATLPRFVVLPDGQRFLPLEKVISAHLGLLFEGMEIVEHVPFRVTRNADLAVEEEEADDLLVAVEMELRRRRFGRAVRLEIDARASAEVRDLLIRELELTDEDVYESFGPLDLGGLWALGDLDRPDLKEPPWAPVTPGPLTPGDDEHSDFFATIRAGDLLVHHPYESFVTSVEEFIRQAARDPQVLAIKITLYRTSGRSAIVQSLIRAAEHGKQVAALVELKARFDEAANIEWARALEEAGVHVTYGLVGLKTHCKTTMVVRDEGGVLRRYCHIGTGNYNDTTAKTYEDVGLFTSSESLGRDVTQLFNFLTGYSRKVEYDQLLVAPHTLRQGLYDLIENEAAATRAGRQGAILMKMNSLVDAPMIDRLYTASSEGVDIELIIRGTCCLRPGVPGLSENIRVRSLIGRYLEHSRIFRFANGAGPSQPAVFISSADLMPRNLDRRVEIIAPIHDPVSVERLERILETELADNQLAWTLDAEGWWHRERDGIDASVDGSEGGPVRVNAHHVLQQVALSRTRRHELDEESTARTRGMR